MMTRDNSQFWWASTVGTAESVEMNEAMDEARIDCEAGLDVDRCYFEWSALPEEDPAAPATWWGCMPALGHTVTEAKIRQAWRSFKDKTEFARAYCNQRPGEAVEKGPIDVTQFESLADPGSIPTRPFAFFVEVERDRSKAVVALAARRADGLEHWEIMWDGAVEAVAAKLVEFIGRWKPCGVGIDAGGPAGSLMTTLVKTYGLKTWKPSMTPSEIGRAGGALLTVPGLRDIAQSTGDMIDAVAAGTGRWLGPKKQAVLAKAVAGAKTRPLGDAEAWGRRGSAAIAPLVAVSGARWVYAQRAGAYDLGTWDGRVGVH
jgi:hypothetical protein